MNLIEKPYLLDINTAPANEREYYLEAAQDILGFPQTIDTLASLDDENSSSVWDPLLLSIANGNFRGATEIYQTLAQLLDGAYGGKLISYSYGMHGPTYQNILARHRNPNPNTPHKSLMAGCLTPQSMYEYLEVVRSVYPTADTHVADIEGYYTPAFSQGRTKFHLVDLLGPTAPAILGRNTFDSVHSHFLMRAINDTAENNPDVLRSLLTNVRSLLQPRGVFMSVEEYDGVSDPRETWEGLFADAGLSLTIAPALSILYRRQLDRWIQNPNQPSRYQEIAGDSNVLIGIPIE